MAMFLRRHRCWRPWRWAFPVLLVARVVQASGTAVMMPLLMTTLMAVVPEHDRGRVMGNVTLAMSVAPALGPAVSGVVLQSASWRLDLPGGAADRRPASASSACAGCENVGEPQSGTIDWSSVVDRRRRLRRPGLRAQPRSATAGDRTTAYVALAVGLVGIAVFVSAPARCCSASDKPLLDLRTLKLPHLLDLARSLMSVAFMAMLGSMILLPLYLQNVRG